MFVTPHHLQQPLPYPLAHISVNNYNKKWIGISLLWLIVNASYGNEAPKPEELRIKCTAPNFLEGAAPPKGKLQRCIDKNGHKQGSEISWYSNGKPMQHLQFKDNQEHGKQRAWWPNGQRMMEGISVNGERYPGFTYWNILGQAQTIDFKQLPDAKNSSTQNQE